MSAVSPPATFGVARDRLPICACGSRRAVIAICDFNGCGLMLCLACLVEDFGRDLCAGHAEHEGIS